MVEENNVLVPKIPIGVSGTALAASLLRDGWSVSYQDFIFSYWPHFPIRFIHIDFLIFMSLLNEVGKNVCKIPRGC